MSGTRGDARKRMEHRWTDRDGQTWVCDAYDHGPMCRLCRPVPSTDEDRLQKAAETCKAAGYRVLRFKPERWAATETCLEETLGEEL